MRLGLLGLLFILLISCSEEKEALSSTDFNRPYNPWIFRSVLDEKPRMLTLALHDDLWAAYHTSSASIYKAWKGRVNFDGAVYTSYHGPQPTSIGDAYFVNKYENPWLLTGPRGENLQIEVDYKGHRYVDDQAEIMYNLISGDYTIKLVERVDAVRTESGSLEFRRDFDLTMPSVLKLYLQTNLNSIVDTSMIETDGELEIITSESKKYGKKEVTSLSAKLLLNRGETKFYTSLMDFPVVENPWKGKYEEGDDEALPPGALLIAKSDCKSCHNKKVKTVGPSYLAIAKKYADTEDNMEILVNKVKKGGGGVWGSQVMTAHPEYTKADIGTMVSYILSLGDPETDAEIIAKGGDLSMIKSTDLKVGDLIPGAVVRVYKVPETASKIPDYSIMEPFQAGIMPKFDNIADNDFGDLVENFGLEATGFVEVPEDGKYKFRVWSDDGSRVTLSGRVILDHDGPHGVSHKETTVSLQKGYHPFHLEYYQGMGGKFLSFNWKPENAGEWQVIPARAYSHFEKDHELIGDLHLPMSVTSKLAGDQAKLEDVHPSIALSQARPSEFFPKVGGLDFLPDGRMVISTWDAAGNVYIVDQRKKDPEKITYKKIATGLAEPLGLKVVDGTIYIMQKQEMTRLVDTDGDEIIDEYQTLCDDWGVSANFHEFGFGLEEKDGWLYANLATGILPGGASMPDQHKDRGNAIRVNVKTGELERMAHGMRTPNGVGKGYNGDIFLADNEGDWLPSSKIIHLNKGDWYGSRSVDFEGTEGLKEVKPVVWLPQDEIGNSPTQMVGINFGPYKNQMLHGDVYHGGLKRVFVEEVNGKLQGAVFRFTQGLEAAVNRIRWGPDKSLYVGGIGNPGNWGQRQKLWYGLQKLTPTDETAFEILAVRAKTNGIELEFTENLVGEDGWNPASYEIKQWHYTPTVNYGGPKIDVENLFVKSASKNKQGNKVFLELDGMKEDKVVYVRLRENFVSHKEHSLWSTEAWYTMNSIPENLMGEVDPSPVKFETNTLSAEEKAAGWISLFNGQTIDDWHLFNKADHTGASKWTVAPDGSLYFNPKANGEGGDIISNREYENFELALEWKISNCGNSGIMFNVIEDEKYCCPYLTGVEMQVLDNVCHPDTKFPTHQAGDLYDMIAANPVTVKPAGEWNKVKIVSNNGKVVFWLNGREVVNFEMHNAKWLDMIKNSKFIDMPDFGLAKKGKIALQDHSDPVWYRNIKIKEL
jgi:cytochrome c